MVVDQTVTLFSRASLDNQIVTFESRASLIVVDEIVPFVFRVG